MHTISQMNSYAQVVALIRTRADAKIKEERRLALLSRTATAAPPPSSSSSSSSSSSLLLCINRCQHGYGRSRRRRGRVGGATARCARGDGVDRAADRGCPGDHQRKVLCAVSPIARELEPDVRCGAGPHRAPGPAQRAKLHECHAGAEDRRHDACHAARARGSLEGHTRYQTRPFYTDVVLFKSKTSRMQC